MEQIGSQHNKDNDAEVLYNSRFPMWVFYFNISTFYKFFLNNASNFLRIKAPLGNQLAIRRHHGVIKNIIKFFSKFSMITAFLLLLFDVTIHPA
jgi:hypothetical protein